MKDMWRHSGSLAQFAVCVLSNLLLVLYTEKYKLNAIRFKLGEWENCELDLSLALWIKEEATQCKLSYECMKCDKNQFCKDADPFMLQY